MPRHATVIGNGPNGLPAAVAPAARQALRDRRRGERLELEDLFGT